MSSTLLFLQSANFLLAGASLWIYYWNLNYLAGQAVVYTSGAGFVIACATLLMLGLSLLVSPTVRWLGFLLHLLMALCFFGLQGYLLYYIGRQLGFFPFLSA